MVIEMSDVSWRREQKMILRDISWRVRPGEHWCLVGLNGSGKTTLLNLINGYIWPTKGEMAVLGNRFGRYDLRELRKSIGWVSSSLQQKLHGNETAVNIVLSGKFGSIGLYDKTDARDMEQAVALMTSLGCQDFTQRTYDTLSQGERQKVLIGRALMASPKLLILDEPCTGLDLFARERLLETIGQIATDRDPPTLLYVTHHIEEILPCFTHTLLLKKGEMYEAGQTADVLTSERLSGFFEVPVEVQEREERKWITLGTL